MTSGPEAFGFVPAHVVADLQDIGNWKCRATAIDVLHKCLNGVANPATLVPALEDFVKFLADLVADPNFKIAISAMSILGDLAGKVGSELGPYLRVVVPALLDKFADSKVMVHSAAMKLVRRLMSCTCPGAVLPLLAPGGSHTNWRVREEVLNAVIMALLSFGPGSYDPAAAYTVLCGCLSDPKDVVRSVALEGMAVLHSRLGSGQLEALMAGQQVPAAGGGSKAAGRPLPESLRAQVTDRLANPALPGVNGEGLVEHVVALPLPAADNPDMRLADAALGLGGGGGGGKMPWAETPARPRLRAAAHSEGPASFSPPGRHDPSPGPSLDQVGRLGSDPLPGCRREGVPPGLEPGSGGGAGGGGAGSWQHPPDDPACLGAAHHRVGGGQLLTPGASRFGTHEPAGPGVAPVAANGWDWSHPGIRTHPCGDRSASPVREPSGATGAVLPVGSAPEGGAGVGPIAHGHASALQPLKHPWGASRSLESQGHQGPGGGGAGVAGRSPADNIDDIPLSPSRGYTVLVHGGRQPASGDTGQHHHHTQQHYHHPHPPQRESLDMLTRPASVSVRTQAAAELREEARASMGGPGPAAGPVLHGVPHPHPQHWISAPPGGSSGQSHPPPGGSSGQSHPHPHPSSSSSVAAVASSSSAVGWLQHNLEPEPAGSGSISRQETFSPSKAEMLARLKNRQIEKRAATAQLDASFTSVASDVSTASAPAGAHSFTSSQNPPRRYLFTQLSDQQRDPLRENRSARDRERDRSARERERERGPHGSERAPWEGPLGRGRDSAVATPTRPTGSGAVEPLGGDEAPPGPAASQSHRPPRGGVAARLGRGGTGASAEAAGWEGGAGPAGGGPLLVQPGIRSPTLPGAPGGSPPGEDTPLRNPSPSPSSAFNRLRARSADPNPTPGAGGPGPTAAPASAGALLDKSRGAGAGGGEVPAEELTPVPDPEKHIRLVISRLTEANHADRKELDWQGQFEALTDCRRLVRHHPAVVTACLREFVRVATPAVDQLRSQTSKCALALFQECFSQLGRSMDRELEDLVPLLLKKAGEVSNAGRDNWLAAEADRALAEMTRYCGEGRAAAALLGCAGHRNPYVRGKVAFHLDAHLEACAGAAGGRAALAGNSAALERLFRAAAGFLAEGSLDTRTHGKRIIWHVKALLAGAGAGGGRGEFDRLVAGLAPEALQRKVVDVVEGLNGPPPPPSRGVLTTGGGGGAGSRLASRPLMAGMGMGMGGGVASPARPLLEQVVGLGGGGGSLTQPPPPVRQGSYSAPAPMHYSAHSAGGATPERRRQQQVQLRQQRTSDLDGIPEAPLASGYYSGSGAAANGSGGGSRSNSSNGRGGRGSAAGTGTGGITPVRQRPIGSADGGGSSTTTGGVGSAGPGAGAGAGFAAAATGGFGPGVSEVVVKALQLLGAKDFRERMEALRSVAGVATSLAGAPDSLLLQVLDALTARLGDANAKVALAALELVGALAGALRGRMSPGLNTLVPALAAALGSTNDKVRAAAVAATDALLSALEPAALVQHLSHCVANGTLTRGKPILAEKLVAVVGALYGAKPTLVARYALPALFALLNETGARGGGVEAKAAAGVLLAGLARTMGPALLEAAGGLNAVAQQRVADAVAAAATAVAVGVMGDGAGGGNLGGAGRGGGAGAVGGRERDRTPKMARTYACAGRPTEQPVLMGADGGLGFRMLP